MAGRQFSVRWHVDRRPQVRAKVDRIVSAALLDVGEYLRDQANRTVPHRDGDLQRSSVTSVDGHVAAVSYDTPYARRQHEELGYRHKQGRRAKWLQATWNEERSTIERHLAKRVGGRFGLVDVTLPLANDLASRLGLTIDVDGNTGDVYVDHVPPTPDRVWCVIDAGGPTPDGGGTHGYDDVDVQVRVRGGHGESAYTALDAARDVYDAYQGLHHYDLPGGPRLVSCIALGRPASLGPDSEGRPEAVVNFRAHVRNVTTHRQ